MLYAIPAVAPPRSWTPVLDTDRPKTQIERPVPLCDRVLHVERKFLHVRVPVKREKAALASQVYRKQDRARSAGRRRVRDGIKAWNSCTVTAWTPVPSPALTGCSARSTSIGRHRRRSAPRIRRHAPVPRRCCRRIRTCTWTPPWWWAGTSSGSPTWTSSAAIRPHPVRDRFSQHPYEWDRELRALRAMHLPVKDEAKILADNALRLFGA